MQNLETQDSKNRKIRVVVLNAIPLNAIPFTRFMLLVQRVSLPELFNTIVVHAIRHNADSVEFVHYVRHPATLKLLRKYLSELSEQPNSGLYKYQDGDILVVVTLRNPQRGQEVAQLSEDDLDIAVVVVV